MGCNITTFHHEYIVCPNIPLSERIFHHLCLCFGFLWILNVTVTCLFGNLTKVHIQGKSVYSMMLFVNSLQTMNSTITIILFIKGIWPTSLYSHIIPKYPMWETRDSDIIKSWIFYSRVSGTVLHHIHGVSFPVPLHFSWFSHNTFSITNDTWISPSKLFRHFLLPSLSPLTHRCHWCLVDLLTPRVTRAGTGRSFQTDPVHHYRRQGSSVSSHGIRVIVELRIHDPLIFLLLNINKGIGNSSTKKLFSHSRDTFRQDGT